MNVNNSKSYFNSFWKKELKTEIKIELDYRESYLEKFKELLKLHGSVERVKKYLVEINQVKRAKKKAKNLGLSYWPALLDCPKVDSNAFLIAEEILYKKTGKLYGKDKNGVVYHGGWDSYGHYGPSPYFVQQAFFMAGCKNTEKFRAQVFYNELSKKGESAKRFLDYVRGNRWAKSASVYYLSRKALITLGKLSPELRWAATRNLSKFFNPIRVRDLNWEEVKRIELLRKEKEKGVILRAVVLPTNPARAVMGLPFEKGHIHPVTDEMMSVVTPKTPSVREYLAGLECPEGVVWIVRDNIFFDVRKTKNFHGYCIHSGYIWKEREKIVGTLIISPDGSSYHTKATGKTALDEAKKGFLKQNVYNQLKKPLVLPENFSLIVTREDSYNSGNCKQGTEGFLERNFSLNKWYVKATDLVKTKNPKAINAVKAALGSLELGII